MFIGLMFKLMILKHIEALLYWLFKFCGYEATGLVAHLDI